ncbi:hypothetical protein BO78DRAFT_412435 [Aspergillus sclerotiicarbonarius CBS 121057]|uniref:Serine hydrolase domain-containing protein n=1 Tax=Aspergillus sclerotiicarbonarius (strain CBS 121057 / IBT 28362) TaxID=1448318 RepID=A0A319EHE8_ASPSB|nr:hypothetical protein BO78DRAFT_412435 [Aspergillus sclerotiicarbonarius CBS 121057]
MRRNNLTLLTLAAVRHSLDPHYTYEWLNGPIPTEMAPGLEEIISPGDEFLQYVIDSHESQAEALINLEQYIDEEGPFDGLLAFSQGAGCGATYLIHQMQQGNPRTLLTGVEESLAGETITIPTAHVWGRNNHLWRFGPALSAVCPRDPVALARTVRAIRRTIARAGCDM